MISPLLPLVLSGVAFLIGVLVVSTYHRKFGTISPTPVSFFVRMTKKS
jgi:hypothetical protein